MKFYHAVVLNTDGLLDVVFSATWEDSVIEQLSDYARKWGSHSATTLYDVKRILSFNGYALEMNYSLIPDSEILLTMESNKKRELAPKELISRVETTDGQFSVDVDVVPYFRTASTDEIYAVINSIRNLVSGYHLENVIISCGEIYEMDNERAEYAKLYSILKYCHITDEFDAKKTVGFTATFNLNEVMEWLKAFREDIPVLQAKGDNND